MAFGKIKKLVLVPAAGPRNRSGAPSEGYGIIAGEDGSEVFFLDSVVNGVAFCDLEKGQEVRYGIEDGPLHRADIVTPRHRETARSTKAQRSNP